MREWPPTLVAALTGVTKCDGVVTALADVDSGEKSAFWPVLALVKTGLRLGAV